MSDGGTIDNLLDAIPGYGGYREKDRRRESDRLIREKLALDYGQQADRLGEIARSLAESRKIMLVPIVDQPHSRLVAFCNRVRTASYGYAPLFGDRQIDGSALDQIAAFDQSMADQLELLSAKITELEGASPDTDEFKAIAYELDATIRGLQARFDLRGEIVETGTALEQQKVAGLLETPKEPPAIPTAYKLHQNEAITRQGINYSIVGRIATETPTGSWRDFQLDGGDGRSFFQAPADETGRFRWLHRVELTGTPGEPQVGVSGSRYELVSSEGGTSEVLGTGGGAENRPVTCYQYRQQQGSGILTVYDWGADHIALAGEEIDPLEVEVWTREGRETI